MRTNRGKTSNRRGKQHGTNIAKFVAPALILLLLGWGVYELFIKEPTGPGPQPQEFHAPVSPANGKITATIYFDNSSSMKGYADASNNTYIDILSDLRGFYQNTGAIIGSELIDGDELIDRIRLHKINYTNESLLYRDIGNIATKVQEEFADTVKGALSINFYVTDGIMSGSDAKIREDSEYNKIHAQDLQNQISKALEGKDSVAISVYQFGSPFVGEYWAYDNEHHTLPSNCKRNFYVIAIGGRSVLANFKQKVDSISSDQIDSYSKFIPSAQWHAIDDQIVNTNLRVGPNGAVNFNGEAYCYKPKVINNQDRCILFNLDTDVFRNQYIENMDTLAYKSIVEIDGRQMKDIVLSWDEKAHALTFQIPTSKLAKKNKIRLTIPKLKPLWIERSSVPDDKYMFSRPDERTFLFDKFMQGIQNGINGASSPIIYQREIILKQE